MLYYHYTSLKALSSILQDNSTQGKEICFWATRYDCFRDKTEYMYGIAKMHPALEKFEFLSGLQADRKIAHYFNPIEIERAVALPVPYVISISARKDNEYMWDNYADNGQGVVMELEFNKLKGFYQAALYSIESCVYDSEISNEELYKLVKDKYFEMASIMLDNNKELAVALLRDYPTAFVRLIAMYLLAFVAPRFKNDEYIDEEETRIIISSPIKEYNNLLDTVQCPAMLETVITEVKRFVDCEKQRPDNNNFFREIFMPISVLKRIFVKNDIQRHEVEEILIKKGLGHISVEAIE